MAGKPFASGTANGPGLDGGVPRQGWLLQQGSHSRQAQQTAPALSKVSSDRQLLRQELRKRLAEQIGNVRKKHLFRRRLIEASSLVVKLAMALC